MSANFKNNTATMSGIDLHTVKFLPPMSPKEIVTGHAVEDWPHAASIGFASPAGDEGKRTSKLTADKAKMIREGFTIGKVSHVPMLGPFHPAEAVQLAKIIKNSKTKVFMTIMSVTSEGDPLAICLKGPVGIDLNCNSDDSLMPTGMVLCLCSVETQPTVKDFVFRTFDEFIKKWLAKKIISLIDQIVKALKPRFVPDFAWKVPRAIAKWIAKKVVPKAIDRAEDVAKRHWDTVGKAAERAADRAKKAAEKVWKGVTVW